LGLAIGIVGFVAVLIWDFWAMHHGMPKAMIAMHVPALTVRSAFEHALFVLIKGFLFGFFVALLYDLFVCCCARRKSE
jgi:chromate transport protein ChrA